MMQAAQEKLPPAPAKSAGAAIEVNHLTKAFYDSQDDRVTVAVSDVSFKVERGEFVCIVGPSGCGKTTVLRILAGLEDELNGTVKLHSSTPPAMVFQEASVLPWLTVSQNIAFPLSLTRHAPFTTGRTRARNADTDRPYRIRQRPPPPAFRRHETTRLRGARPCRRPRHSADGRAVRRAR
ncbi:putative sulfonate ABC transporter ATP-binding protein [Nitratireductor aquibiodomus RA22]|uniref:Putative sulfonate ABC transporter ATP-binding protein n=1 Tax=Nitratireductor aquibiodomus RA22 TaxID=1189611 RepID=I5C6T8_9HYPH|nr:putative sulfonate ABC transporter ATP-binding protein [Nitratireductor aquibiodomus RA22]